VSERGDERQWHRMGDVGRHCLALKSLSCRRFYPAYPTSAGPKLFLKPRRRVSPLGYFQEGERSNDDRILQGTALMMVALSVWMVMALLAS